MPSFSDFPLLKSLQHTLKEKELTTPTEIQTLAIPKLLEGGSVVAVSETGSGKTLAFALPILHIVKEFENNDDPVEESARPRALVVVPSRELGEQVSKVFKPFTHSTRVRVRTALGGTDMEVSRKNVSAPFEILVATPGRLVKLMEIKKIDLTDVRILVFDEADQMLDEGFLPAAIEIAKACEFDPQMALFSATVSKPVQALMTDLFQTAEVIRSKGSHKVVANLKTENRTVLDGKRMPLLEKVLKEKTEGGTLIFTNTREQCDKLAELLHEGGHKVVIYRGEMDKMERRRNLKAFREGKVDLLISTDLGSRGLDVEHIGRVINYHMPQQMDNYLHRVGRTARAGRAGLVINFITERDEPMLEKIKSVKF